MLFGSWLDKFKKPIYGYDIDIGQRGKVSLDVRKNATKAASLVDKPSGLHPGVESGYQGGLTRGYLDEHGDNKGRGYWYAPTSGDPNSATMNKIPTLTENIVGYKGGGILDKLKDKKKFEYIMEAFDNLEGATPTPLAAGKNVGASGIKYTPTDMGAYVDNPVATQAALAEARRKKEKEGLMNLLYGSYV